MNQLLISTLGFNWHWWNPKLMWYPFLLLPKIFSNYCNPEVHEAWDLLSTKKTPHPNDPLQCCPGSFETLWWSWHRKFSNQDINQLRISIFDVLSDYRWFRFFCERNTQNGAKNLAFNYLSQATGWFSLQISTVWNLAKLNEQNSMSDQKYRNSTPIKLEFSFHDVLDPWIGQLGSLILKHFVPMRKRDILTSQIPRVKGFFWWIDRRCINSFQPAMLVDPGEWGHPFMGEESHGIYYQPEECKFRKSTTDLLLVWSSQYGNLKIPPWMKGMSELISHNFPLLLKSHL